MPDDKAIIKQIEQQIGIKLAPIPLEKIMYSGDNGFALDEAGQVVGLNLYDCQIKNIPDLSGLARLTYLSLAGNQITGSDLPPLRALTNLTRLDLQANQITGSDLTPLSALTNLERLWLNNNRLTGSDLTPLSALTNLKQLWLNDNQITGSDLTPLSALTKLTILSLDNNQITGSDLTPLRDLKDLVRLDLRNNRIETLPPEITEWWPGMEIKWEEYRTSGLNLYGNPLEDPPVEIVKQGTEAVKNYFAEIQQASVLFLESKLLLVGSGDVGKTTIMKKLKDKSFKVKPGTEDTTRGIDIQPWQQPCTFPDGQTHDVKIHFWDFGGQEILHATHQFFLTKRSLYLFVWEARKEEEIQSFDYWLNAVKLLGAESPVIMVMNKSELRIKQIAEDSFKEKFPNIVGFLQVSCLENHRIGELAETIRSSLSGMPHLLDKLPKRWLDIRDTLTNQPENYITLPRYFEICRSHHMDEDKALFLSDYLHDLGIILHFRTDPLLADTVILKPGWATGAVYALIDSLPIQKNNGRFSRSQLPTFWNKDLYPTDKHQHLLRLMEKFELCFNIVGSDDYIIPELLQAERRDIDVTPYRSSSNLHLHYSYDFMPAGIVTRFITRLHYLVPDDHYWKNGVELRFYGSYALVVSDPVQRRIRISVSGSSPVQLMAIIRTNFDHIHDTLNMKKDVHVFEEVPCNCSQCSRSQKPYFFKYDYLDRLSKKGLDARCETSLEDIPTGTLLDHLRPTRQPKDFHKTLLTILSKIQGISIALPKEENSRNTIVAQFLEAYGFRVKDQTLWSRSYKGEYLGELDFKIDDDTGRAVSIIEAFKLNRWDFTVTRDHILKLFQYDCNGLAENYIVVYVSETDFSQLCEKYREHLEKIDYKKNKLLGQIETPTSGFNKITVYRARHRCNDGETVLNHILVEL